MAADTEIQPSQVFSPAEREAAAARAAYIAAHWADTAGAYAQAVIEEDWRALEYASVEEWPLRCSDPASSP